MPELFTPPADLRDIHTIYTAEPEKTSDPAKWPRLHVRVYRNHVDGTKEQVHEYGRNYSMLRTFEPFRQFRDGAWHEYALISPSYTTFQVLDLATCEVVATRPFPQRPWFKSGERDEYATLQANHPEYFAAGAWAEGKGPDDMVDGPGFCPMSFYVPDISEEVASVSDFEADKDASWFATSVQHFLGQGGFVGGCHWGDDSSTKLRYVDLSRISEGVVIEDERFGYWELPGGGRPLSDFIDVDEDQVYIHTSVSVSLETGEASPYARDGINWGSKR